MKKRIALLLSGLLLLGCLGCGEAETTTESDSQVVTESSTEVQSEASDETVSAEVSETQKEAIKAEYVLKDLFAEHGMKVGTCLTPQMISNKKQSALILEQFSSITMENAMKPDYLFNKKASIAAGDLVVEFSKDAIKMLDWAKENGMAVRGHTLVWHSQTPSWIFHEDFDLVKPLVGREVMLARLESYFKQIFGQLEELGYADIIYAYDVVNEAWMEDGSKRDSDWLKTIGEDYLWQAFYFADKYAPENINLFYNDYNEQFKEGTLYDFVNTLVDENGNYLIDGVGFQAHLYTKDSLKDYFRTLDKLASTGLIVQLTELDVCLGSYQNPLSASEDNLATQGKFYYDLINGIFERVDAGTLNTDALTFWGFADNLSWRKEYSPLLYNSKLEPKYAFFGAMQEKDQAGF